MPASGAEGRMRPRRREVHEGARRKSFNKPLSFASSARPSRLRGRIPCGRRCRPNKSDRMSLAGEHILLRAYLRGADRPPHVPTYEMVVKAARGAGLAGATVFRGILGLGSTGLLRPSTWSLIEHVPVLVEIVDSAECITDFVEDTVTGLMSHGLITLERAHVMMYRQRRADPPTAGLSLGGLLQPLSTVPRVRTGGHMKVNQDGVL